MVTKRSKSYILIRFLLKDMEKNHNTFEDDSISNLPSTEKSTSSALSKHNSDISFIYPGLRRAAKGASKKMFSGHNAPPARVDRQREKGYKAECILHKMAAGLPNYSRY